MSATAILQPSAAEWVTPFVDQLDDDEAQAVWEIGQFLSCDNSLTLIVDNKVIGYRWLDTTNPANECAFIRLRARVLCADFDSSDGIQKARDLASTIPYQTFILCSGTPGHAHLFVIVEAEKPRQRIYNQLKDAGADMRRSVRAPGAVQIKPSKGIRARSVPDQGETFRQLADRLVHRKKGTAKPAKPGKLENNFDIEAFAAQPPTATTDRSSKDYEFAYQCQRQGLSYEEFRELHFRHPNGIGQKVLGKPAKHQEDYLQRTWEAPLKGRPASAADKWQRSALTSKRLKKLAKQTDVGPTIRHLASIARKARRMVIGISARTLGEQIGVHHGTAARHLGLLCEAGLLKIVDLNLMTTQARTYRLKSEQTCDTTNPTGSFVCASVLSQDCPLSKHDCFSGAPAQRSLYNLLDSVRPLTAKEIAKRLGRDPSSIRKTIKALGDRVQLKGTGWVRVEDKSLCDAIAKLRGTDRRTVERIERHQRNRAGFYSFREATVKKWIQEQREDPAFAARHTAARRKATQERTQSHLKPHPATDQATQNGSKTEHLPGSKRKQNGSEFHANEGVRQPQNKGMAGPSTRKLDSN